MLNVPCTGGTNPALRTFYYRLLRLIALSIHPIFVFDGPNKPPFKRNKRTGPNVASIPEFLAKQLLKQFGFPIHLAPGEAEAECALLQREGIVDAVLSEDVDTLMFGSGLTIRNWSPELKTGKTPTHVNVYDAVQTKNGPSGLDREGMILVALMSGGDYVPEGIPGIGPKTACEVARAGFGHDLCKIAPNDTIAMAEWRERLRHELNTNESKLFTRKRPSMRIPDDFPRTDILGYYTHPAVSSQAGLEKLKQSIKWDQDIDFAGLRAFTSDAFDWVRLEGAKHFIRSLAPSLLIRQLRIRGEQANRLPSDDLQAIEEDEALLVKGIHGRRQHSITDNAPELRVSFAPIELVKVDLSSEEPDEEIDTQGLAPTVQLPEPDLDDELALEVDDDAEAGPKKRGPTKFDPYKPARVWVLDTYAKVGVPLKVQDWEAGRQKPSRAKRQATTTDSTKAGPRSKGARRAKPTGDTAQSSIQAFAKVTKPGSKLSQSLAKAQSMPSEHLAVPQPQAQPSRVIVNLLSSSPVRPITAISNPSTREKSISPVQEELPSSVTRRSRRAPMQRANTLPSDCATAPSRSGTPPLGKIETLDLVDSPARLPISRQVAGDTGTRPAKNAPAPRTRRGASIVSSPAKDRQSTLDAYRKQPAFTSAQPRHTSPPANTAPTQPPTAFPPPRNDPETLDLTLFSPLPLDPTPRPPPKSYSPSEPFDCLDLSGFSSPRLSPSPRPPQRRTPLAEISPPQETVPRRTSPPAAWKAQAKKKREVILRKSLAGAWAFVDTESPTKQTADCEGGMALKGMERRRWRESEIEVLDLS